MSDYKPEVGHRVRVIHTLEGVLTGVADKRYFNIREDGRTRETYMTLIGGSVSVERLPDPEPEWQPGDVVIDARGDLYRRRAPQPHDDPAWAWNRGGLIGHGVWDQTLARPLTPLILNGKPVSA
jgi:hypothetical protein